MKLSLVINADTRNGFQNENSKADGLFNGCTSEDFLIDGVLNKQKFFEGFETETILHIDMHEEIPLEVLTKLQKICDTVLIRKHTDESNFNDYSYLRALFCASGDIICHFDQDTAAFTSSPKPIHGLIKLLDYNKFISYPSHWTPRAVTDASFGHRTWASTRFFICKPEALQFETLKKCLKNPEWAYAAYGDSPRRCNWLEHFLTLINENSCYYPPMYLDNYAIFSWASYKQGTLKELNNMDYSQIRSWLNSHPIVYPNDVNV